MNFKTGLQILIGFLLALSLGCNSSSSTGKVYVNDLEVHNGSLLFNPDLQSGTDGPSVLANVSGGTYRTLEGKAVTPGTNTVMLTVSTKWLNSGGTDTSDVDETGAVTTLTQSFDIQEGTFDLKFDFDSDAPAG